MTDSKDFAACSAAQLFQIYTKTDEILDPDKKVLHQYFKSAILHALHDEAAKEALSDNVISTLSSLICGGGNPVTDLPRLKKELGAGGPCGKILQCNDPTFCCLDCALDKTCVMCMECYNASPHAAEKHNLHVNTSRGHGMCDCGDEEAWKYVSFHLISIFFLSLISIFKSVIMFYFRVPPVRHTREGRVMTTLLWI